MHNVEIIEANERGHDLESDQFRKIMEDFQVVLCACVPKSRKPIRNLLNVLLWNEP
jgi:hypothetical protein